MTKKNQSIELFPPEEIADRNTLFAWAVIQLRKVIAGAEDLSGELKPLGNIEIVHTTEALEYVGLSQAIQLQRLMKSYEERFGTRILPVGKSIYLKSDIHLLKIWLDMKEGRIRPDQIIVN